ncbi:MAG: protein-L-isoaspartate(D-aspartate) O-methyltransferase [Proteobacteria bacterium]|nr:protein-L-isoaspartate(D-aspartate) O-methyltransferase [Pseudomonadota bacterium]
MGEFAKERQAMVERHLKARDISDPKVLAAMGKVRREAFIPEQFRINAYADRPLPIGEGQTISQPYIVALMTQALELKGGETVLEIGAGSGYAAAVLSEIADQVFTIERHQPLADAARKTLKAEGIKNVTVICGDGTKGLEKEAPFDAIVATAAGPKVPETLKKQLKISGRLVVPVGGAGYFQRLMKITRTAEDKFEQADLGGVSFVPLIGEEGY